jgi:hypothetical protein
VAKIMWSENILDFYESLNIMGKIPRGVEVMNPYQDKYTFSLCEKFYRKYYNDNNQRFLILGINPGRFGSGTTGIAFTDPIKLEKECGIENTFQKRTELSADFIYKVIHSYGGLESFYNNFFFSSISPLGFTKDGININYYDDPKLQKAILPFILQSMNTVTSWNVSRRKCFCLGEGKNFKFLHDLNKKHQWFDEVVPLSHPRFIMQYKRKLIHTYIDDYMSKLNSIES